MLNGHRVQINKVSKVLAVEEGFSKHRDVYLLQITEVYKNTQIVKALVCIFVMQNDTSWSNKWYIILWVKMIHAAAG